MPKFVTHYRAERGVCCVPNVLHLVAAAVELMRRLVDDVADIEAENRWLPSEAIIIKIEQDRCGVRRRAIVVRGNKNQCPHTLRVRASVRRHPAHSR
jgi:hypothetical protein